MDMLFWIILIIILSPVIVFAGFIVLGLVCLILVLPVMLIIEIMDLIF